MVVTALQTAPHYFPPFSLYSLTSFLHFDHFFTPSWLASAGVFPLFIFLLRLVLLPQLLSRYVFSWGSIRCGISLCAGVHQCLSARTQPERLHGGYCHCGTIITSAVSQTGVCPHIHTCTHIHTLLWTHCFFGSSALHKKITSVATFARNTPMCDFTRQEKLQICKWMLIFAFLFVCVHLSAQYLCGAVLSELTCTRESFCIHVLHVTMSLDEKRPDIKKMLH